jgi:hypothetical protein
MVRIKGNFSTAELNGLSTVTAIAIFLDSTINRALIPNQIDYNYSRYGCYAVNYN